jgi:hypothetical protein
VDIGDLTKVDYSENIKYPTSVWFQFWRLTQRSFIKLWRGASLFCPTKTPACP